MYNILKIQINGIFCRPIQNELKFRIEFLLLTKAHNFSCAVSNLYNPNRFNGFRYFQFI